MNPAKKFMLILALVSMVLWIGVNVVMGGPALSAEYMAEHGTQHERYLEIIKGTMYKNYVQRPNLNGPGQGDVPERFQDDIDFVAQYTSNPAFVEQKHRIALRGYFFEFFNAALVLILVVRFARKPLANLLDEKVTELKERLETAALNRKNTEQRIADAKAKVDDIPAEKKRVAAATDERIEYELAELEKANQQSLEVMGRERDERKEKQRLAAATLVKRELVNNAIDSVIDSHRKLANDSNAQDYQAELLNKFLRQLEKGV